MRIQLEQKCNWKNLNIDYRNALFSHRKEKTWEMQILVIMSGEISWSTTNSIS